MSLMTQRHFIYLADNVAPLMSWPTQIHKMADELAATNPKFNRDKFIQRAVAAWEKANPREPIDDHIPY